MPPLNQLQKNCLAIAIAQAVMPSHAQAATITVVAPGQTGCSLYSAVASANTNTSVGGCTAGDDAGGDDTIALPYNETFSLTGGSIDGLLITSNITIQGNSSEINNGTTNKRLINVNKAVLTISEIFLRDGNLEIGDGPGAAIKVEEGSSLKLINSEVSDNYSADGGGAIYASKSAASLNRTYIRDNSSGKNGGGLLLGPFSTLAADLTKFYGNTATSNGGSIHVAASSTAIINQSQFGDERAHRGGALYSTGIAEFYQSNIKNNTADNQGGAIFASAGSVTINESRINYNSANLAGGAIAVSANTNLTISKSTINGNQANGGTSERGGAILIDLANGHDAKINNSVFFSNHADIGAGIYLQSGALELVNSTLADVPTWDSVQSGSSMLHIAAGNTAALSNSVVSTGYGRPASSGQAPTNVVDCYLAAGAAIQTNTNNFFSDSSCDGNAGGDPVLDRPITFYPAHFLIPEPDPDPYNYSYNIQIGVTPDQATLYQASQSIVVPLPNSPLVNSGNASICSSAPINGVDQRGLPHNDATCDIGSIDSSESVILVDSLVDGAANNLSACTLRDAIYSSIGTRGEFALKDLTIRDASTCVQSKDRTTITFEPNLFSSNASIILQNYLPTIRSNVTIQGPGTSKLTLDGAGQHRVLDLFGASAAVSNLTIANGSNSNRGGGIFVTGSGLNLERINITGNIAGRGAGVYAGSSSDITIRNSSISSNLLTNPSFGEAKGGGLYLRSSTATIIGSTIDGNTIAPGEASNTIRGAGIFMRFSASLSLLNSTLSNNLAYLGGGVYADGGDVYIYNTTVTGNSAIGSGGGITLFSGAELLASNTIFAGNTSGSNFGHEVRSLSSSINPLSGNNLIGDSSKDFNEAISSPGAWQAASSDDFIATNTDLSGAANPDSTPLADIIEPLQNNGGVTRTHALLMDSPAVNRGAQANCNAKPQLTFDQIGNRRDSHCDIGSFEYIEDETCFVIKAANSKVVAFCL